MPGDAVAGEAGVQCVAVLAGRHGGGPDVLQVQTDNPGFQSGRRRRRR